MLPGSTLDHIFDSNNELSHSFQRWAGYSLTGATTEQKLVFEHGTGGNGKGVTTGTMVGVMGDYAVAAPMETFTASSIDRHPTDLAMLRGARLVTASETEDGRAWAESRIKQMTGGDKISARFMRQDFFEFMPQFKLLIAGNHRPSFRGVDEAIRRRLLLPSWSPVPRGRHDPDLSEKLKPNGGIFTWMIRAAWSAGARPRPPGVVLGRRKTIRCGRPAPLAVRSATDDPQQEAAKDLFSSWTSWAKAAGELVGNEKRFVEALEGAGYVKAKNSAGTKRGFKGLKLNRPDLASDPRYVA